MNIEKTRLTDLKRAYSTNTLVFDNRQFVLFASEANVGEPGFAYAYAMDQLDHQEIVWDNAGGCMSILQHPYNPNEFIAVQEFYLKETPSRSKLVVGSRKDGKWEVKDLVKLPFLHRFGIIKEDDTAYIVACTIAKNKENKDDWSLPGEVWVGALSKDGTVELELLKTGLFRNHGFYQLKEDGKDVIYIGSDNGAYRLSREDGKFVVEEILEGRIGEVALRDIDGDGKLELMTIEPFHGNQIKIYHLDENNKYQEVWKYDQTIDFAHTLVGDTLCGKECFVAGVRRENAEVFAVFYKDGQYVVETIDQGVGPANLCVIHYNGEDYVSCANHTANECAIYKIGE